MADTQGGGQGTEAGNTFAPVFLSYASADKATADTLCTTLESAGIPCWIAPRDVTPGLFYADAIVEAINASRILIVILSAHSAGSQHVLREVERGSSKRKPLIAFRLDTIPLPTGLEYFLSASHWLDASGGPIERAIPPLVDSVKRLLGASSASASSPTDAVGTAGSTPKATRKIWWTATAVGLMALLASGSWLINRTHRVTTPVASALPAILDKSIAVLPFTDMSEKKDQEYFADGMAEEILDLLVKIPGLTVIGRTSSFQFKGRSEDLRTIGEKLGAAYLVEGSLRKAGARIRVTSQLIDAKSGAHLWSESYDRDFGDVLILQDEIATAIARALQLTVGARDARPLRDPRAAESYTVYLRAKVALDRFNASSLAEAQTGFQQALALDPSLLPAAEGLALTYVQRGIDENDISGREAWAHAMVAAKSVLRIDENSATAHSVLGFVAGINDFDWATAESEFNRARVLNPNDPQTLMNSAQIAAVRGHSEEALRLINTSLMLDPLNANTQEELGIALYLNHDYISAESAFRRSLTLNPDIDSSHYFIGLIQLLGGHRDNALNEFRADTENSNRDVGDALVNYALGKKTESDAALARLVEEAGAIWPYGVALVHTYRGERDKAFDWLEKAYVARDIDALTFVLKDPFLAPLHDDHRYKALIHKMNLSEQ